ncbi:hypothetical protein [Streptomyces sp. B1I3]|uniref:hypothetical protein n=1 Tax=Streptomyces sp. B1I3 TaxID=3042264 RepID=UPI0027878DDF|nr:hypothetical protein [Streptomyces sp. B1I3]MDQ0796515.1 hypothetical protein [Streptomyces sp. B1I3]
MREFGGRAFPRQVVLAAPGVEALEVTCVSLRDRFRASPTEAQMAEEAVHILDDRQGGPGKNRPVGQRVSDLDPQDLGGWPVRSEHERNVAAQSLKGTIDVGAVRECIKDADRRFASLDRLP